MINLWGIAKNVREGQSERESFPGFGQGKGWKSTSHPKNTLNQKSVRCQWSKKGAEPSQEGYRLQKLAKTNRNENGAQNKSCSEQITRVVFSMALPFLPWLGPFGLLCSDVVWCRPFPFIYFFFFCNFSVSTVCQLHFSTGPHSNGFVFGVCSRWPASSFNATVSTICWVAPRRRMCVQLRLTFTQVNGPNSVSLGWAKWPSRQFFEGARQPSPFAPLNIYVIGLKFPFGSRKNCTAVWPQWIVRSQPDTSESWPAHGVYSMPYPISCPNLQLHLHTRIKNLEQLQHSFPFAQPQWVLSR